MARLDSTRLELESIHLNRNLHRTYVVRGYMVYGTYSNTNLRLPLSVY